MTFGLIVAALLAVQDARATEHPLPDRLVGAYAEAFNARDAARLAGLFAPDAVLMPPDVPSIRGRAAIEAAYRSRFQHVRGRLRIEPLDFEAHGDRATIVGSFRIVMGSEIDAAPAESERQRSGKYVVIYRRLDGEWLIAFQIMNYDTPQPASAGR